MFSFIFSILLVNRFTLCQDVQLLIISYIQPPTLLNRLDASLDHSLLTVEEDAYKSFSNCSKLLELNLTEILLEASSEYMFDFSWPFFESHECYKFSSYTLFYFPGKQIILCSINGMVYVYKSFSLLQAICHCILQIMSQFVHVVSCQLMLNSELSVVLYSSFSWFRFSQRLGTVLTVILVADSVFPFLCNLTDLVM